MQCRHWADGAAGAEQLARCVVARCESGESRFAPLYDDAMPLADKIRTIATRIYGAGEVAFASKARADLDGFAAAGYGALPICMAKTQVSFSADPKLLGAPSGHVLPVREVRLVGRRRLHRRDLRRHHDHAGPAGRSRRPTRSTSMPTARSTASSERRRARRGQTLK